MWLARVALTLAVAGCGRVEFDPRGDAGSSSAEDADRDGSMATADGSTCTAPFTTVELVPGLSSPALDWGPAESADGLTLYFGSARGGDVDLYRATRSGPGDAWGSPSLIAELALAGDEQDNPAPSTDELELFYGRTNLFRSERPSRTQPFQAPTQLFQGAAIFGSPQGPFLSADHLSLYFTAILGADNDILVATRPTRTSAFDGATPLVSINTQTEDGWPHLTDDELTIYYTSQAAGSRDLWVATRPTKADAFGNARLVEVVNSPSDEYDPALSADGQTLYFASNRAGGPGDYDLYRATRTCP